MDTKIRHGAGGGPSTPTIAPITLLSEDTIEVNLGICEGPIVGLVAGPKSFYLGNTALMSPNGDSNFDPFELHVYHGADAATPVRNALGGTTSNESVGVAMAQDVPVVRTTQASSRNLIDVIEIRLFINALQKVDSSGNVSQETMKVDLEFREAGTTTWLPFYQGGTTVKITGRINGAIKEFARQVPRINNDWEIRVTKRSPDNDQYEVVDFSWDSFQVTTQENRQYNNLALVRILSQASEQLRGVPQLSGVYAGKIVKIPSNYDPVTRYCTGIWDGTFKLGFTDNPAWVLYDLLDNAVHGARRYYPFLQIDRFSFYMAADWCDSLVQIPGGNYQPRYTFNEEIRDARSGMDLIHYIAGIFGGVLTQDAGGIVVLKVDKPGTPVQLFGPESVSEERFNYQYTDVESRPNTARVTFTNPSLDWADDVRFISIDTYVQRNGENVKDFPAVGCIDVYEAQRRAQLMLLSANTEVTTVTFKTARQHLALSTFDVIAISDPDQKWGLTGRIKSVNGNDIHLRDALFLPINTDITMKVQTPSGVSALTVQTTVASTTKLTVTGGTLPSDLPDRAQFSLEEPSLGLSKPFRVLTVTESEDDPDYAQVVALEINTNKWTDADNLTSSGTIDYAGNPTAPGDITNVQVQSGTSELVKHADGTIESRIRVTWTASAPTRVEVRYRKLTDSQFQVVPAVGTQAYIPNVIDGVDYVLLLQTFDNTGLMTFQVGPIVHTVVGKTAPPSVPTGWGGTPGYDFVTLQGQPHPDKDFSHFNIYGATDLDPTLVLLASISGTVFVRQIPGGDPYTRYAVTAVDTTGNESPPTGFIDLVPDTTLIEDLFESAGIAAPVIVTSLPAGGGPPDLVYLTTDHKLYRWTGSAWTAEVPTTDLTGLVTSSQLIIADTSNLCEDPGFELLGAGWSSTTNGYGLSTSSRTGTYAMARVYGGVTSSFALSNNLRFDVSEGATFRISGYVKRNATGVCSSVGVHINWRAADGSFLELAGATMPQASTTTSYQRVSGLVTAPAGAAYAFVDLIIDGHSAGTFYWDDIYCYRANAGELTVDGTIYGNHIAANTITGGLLATSGIITQVGQIDDAIVTNAKIADATIQGAKIANLAVGTLQVANNAVSTVETATTAASIAGSGTWTTVQSLVVDKGRTDPMSVLVSVDITSTSTLGNDNSPGRFEGYVQVKSGSTVLKQVEISYGSTAGVSTSSSDVYVLLGVDDSGTMGPRTLSVEIMMATGQSMSATNRTLTAFNFLK